MPSGTTTKKKKKRGVGTKWNTDDYGLYVDDI
jgi:hypothetical protein